MTALDLANFATRAEMEAAIAADRVAQKDASPVAIHPATRMIVHRPNGSEYYEAFFFWNCMSGSWNLSVTFYGKNNQGRAYSTHYGSRAYKTPGLLFHTLWAWKETEGRRLKVWIKRVLEREAKITS
jgi:hypothetical protein